LERSVSAPPSRQPHPPSAAPGAAAAEQHPGPAPPASERVRLRRKRERGSYDRTVIDAILDEALIAHLGIVEDDGQPIVTPTLHARLGDVVYCHGSVASRTLRALGGGARACLTVSLLDGLVLARSAMHHSANYRSAMLLGCARSVEDEAEKLLAAQAIVEHVVPGRWREVRPPTENELRATAILAIPIDEASAKVRGGPPLDDEDDYALSVWAGVLPLRCRPGAPVPDPRLPAGIAPPPYLAAYRRPGGP
jgi:nitroimidazol reductase NimA-like FMN-containing flavoprotein (pyridoxamine 5'-phosphate oxidase superfamily)